LISSVLTFRLNDMRNRLITSVSDSDDEIISSIIHLHFNGQAIDLDPTYSTGRFYKSGAIEQPRLKFDLHPQSEGVIKANAEKLPLESNSVKHIMFDPPFLATTGPSLKVDNSHNKINKRFGVYPNEKALHSFYINALRELYRVCEPKGKLIFKCQDKVSSGTQYFSHVFVCNEAEKIGWYAKDLFILSAKHRIVADWQLKNQQHARKFHSYYWVFEKRKKLVKYV